MFNYTPERQLLSTICVGETKLNFLPQKRENQAKFRELAYRFPIDETWVKMYVFAWNDDWDVDNNVNTYDGCEIQFQLIDVLDDSLFGKKGRWES